MTRGGLLTTETARRLGDLLRNLKSRVGALESRSRGGDDAGIQRDDFYIAIPQAEIPAATVTPALITPTNGLCDLFRWSGMTLVKRGTQTVYNFRDEVIPAELPVAIHREWTSGKFFALGCDCEEEDIGPPEFDCDTVDFMDSFDGTLDPKYYDIDGQISGGAFIPADEAFGGMAIERCVVTVGMEIGDWVEVEAELECVHALPYTPVLVPPSGVIPYLAILLAQGDSTVDEIGIWTAYWPIDVSEGTTITRGANVVQNYGFPNEYDALAGIPVFHEPDADKDTVIVKCRCTRINATDCQFEHYIDNVLFYDQTIAFTFNALGKIRYRMQCQTALADSDPRCLYFKMTKSF